MQMRRTQEISELIARHHPEAVSGGFEPTIPAFPVNPRRVGAGVP